MGPVSRASEPPFIAMRGARPVIAETDRPAHLGRFKAFDMWLWLRSIAYMLIVGGAWLALLPLGLIFIETGRVEPTFRSWPTAVTGFTLFALGAALACWAGYVLIRDGRGTPLPLDPTKRLVTVGPYSHVRNPQGIAMTLMACGVALTVHSALIWLLPPLTILYLEGLVGPLENAQLKRKFGPEYQDYVGRVGKWLPRRWAR
jgi:protein-S-isoprenylcysteine O-methyltransferase Ste14